MEDMMAENSDPMLGFEDTIDPGPSYQMVSSEL